MSTDPDDDDFDFASLTLDLSFEVDRRVADIIRHDRRGGRISREAAQFVWDRLGPLLGDTIEEQAASYLRHFDPDRRRPSC